MVRCFLRRQLGMYGYECDRIAARHFGKEMMQEVDRCLGQAKRNTVIEVDTEFALNVFGP